jgi:hypothetical protein
VFNGHQYNVSEAFIFNSTRYVKCHNPHNLPEANKQFKSYLAMEAKLVAAGYPKCSPGEF